MKIRRYLELLLPLLVAGCAAAGEASDGPPYSTVADVQQLMMTVLEPAAEHYWDAVGTILDQDLGTIEIRPETPEEWESVRNAAYVVAESGNLLMMDGRAIDEPGWMAMSRALVDVGRTAIDAASAMDEQAVFDAGAEVYYVCSNCHAAFAAEILRPNDERAN